MSKENKPEKRTFSVEREYKAFLMGFSRKQPSPGFSVMAEIQLRSSLHISPGQFLMWKS